MSDHQFNNNEIYFSGSRPEIAAQVPLGTNKVLDVGCGFGGLGKLLRERKVQKLYGIELNPAASSYLEEIYDCYWIGSVEDMSLSGEFSGFNCIIFADVLEHLLDPWSVLKRYSAHLTKDGKIIASIPNARNLGLIYSLLFKGRWTYGDSGLLDRTHLRFFTRKEIEVLFSQAGLKIEKLELNRDKYSWIRRVLTLIPRMLIPDLEVCQFIIVAKKID